MFDRDGDGNVTLAEFTEFMHSDSVVGRLGGSKLEKQLIARIFNAIDRDGSGGIDFSEFMQCIHERDDGNLEIRIMLQ